MNQNSVEQSKEYQEYMRLQGWEVRPIVSRKVVGYAKKLPLLPLRVLKIQRVKEKDIELLERVIDEMTKNLRPVIAYVEIDAGINDLKQKNEWGDLNRRMKKLGFWPQKTSFLPTKTRIVNINVAEDQLLQQMKPRTRYNIGLSQRRGLISEVLSGDEILDNPIKLNSFLELIHNNDFRLAMPGAHEGRTMRLVQAFANKCYITMTYSSQLKQLLGAALFLVGDQVVVYSSSASNDLGRKLRAPSLAVWLGILEAKRRDINTMDLDGVMDERFGPKKWEGITQFKSGFGGEEVYYPPCYRRAVWK